MFKMNLHILYLLNIMVCCYIFYNMILNMEDFNIDTLII
jgi:hypothetical protein